MKLLKGYDPENNCTVTLKVTGRPTPFQQRCINEYLRRENGTLKPNCEATKSGHEKTWEAITKASRPS